MDAHLGGYRDIMDNWTADEYLTAREFLEEKNRQQRRMMEQAKSGH